MIHCEEPPIDIVTQIITNPEILKSMNRETESFINTPITKWDHE